ncbi:MAG: ATP-grasp domain-containing protein [Rubrivivax sp.]|nr:ATP-grasp domain-containing protein [Rubrivivax sp.]
MTPLLHVLGGSPWQTPTVRRAKALGLRVLVTDMYAERPAYAHADVHEQVDITDLDRTLEAARRHRVQGIVCDTSDVGVPTAAWVAERLGLPGMGYGVALDFTDKARMRGRLAGTSVPIPAHACAVEPEELDAAVRRLGLPVVVKPADNQSGRGVSVVHRPAELAAAWHAALAHSRSRRVVVEAFVAGAEVIADGYVVDGRVELLGLADKTPYAENPTISNRILYRSGAAFEELAPRVRPAAGAVIAALGLRNGVFHAEFMLAAAGVVPIDIAARGGGVMIHTCVLQHVSGVDPIAAMIRTALGQDPDVHPLLSRRGAVVEFLRLPPGVLQAVHGLDAALRVPGVAAIHFNAKPGDPVGALRQKDDRPGFIVALGDSSDEAVRAAQAARGELRATLSDPDRTTAFH